MVDTALISAQTRAGNEIYGRPLLERLLITCRKAGLKRFFIESQPEQRTELASALGAFRGSSEVAFVGSLRELLDGPFALSPETPCISFTGNVVVAGSQLNRILTEHDRHPEQPITVLSADYDESGVIAIGPLGRILGGTRDLRGAVRHAQDLPFALNGRPSDPTEAELRLARALRQESTETDSVLARLLDRRLSWRISYRLAHTRVTANQVTLANTAVGLLSAWLFAIPSYWWRLLGSLLLLLSVTLDGVDGELARLKMVESEAGGRLDTLTDNVVHVAVFTGLMVGCYRGTGSVAYLYLLAVLLGGFAFCAVSVHRAVRVRGETARKWIGQVERATGRDFAYLLAFLALINQLWFFVWGTVGGTYVFAGILWWLTNRRREQVRAA